MKSRKYYISLFFSLLFAAGISLSTLHSHDVGHTESKTGHSFTVDHNQCVICGSVFKTDNSATKPVTLQQYPEVFLYSDQITDAKPKFGSFFDGRAPPLFG